MKTATARKPRVKTYASPLNIPLTEFEPDTDGMRLRERFTNPKTRVYVHICKDGTFTFRRPREKVFNGRALAVYVVDSREEAIALQVLTCFRVSAEHPDMRPGDCWYKLNDVRYSRHQSKAMDHPDMDIPVFEIDDLPRVTAKLHAVWLAHVNPNRDKK